MNRLAIDVGGTFTDLAFVNAEAGCIAIHKVPTTSSDPGTGALAGSRDLLGRLGVAITDLSHIVHATTLVANTLIGRTGARVALITNEGFIDCLDTGIESRYDMFDLRFQRPEPLVPRHLRFGISERTAADGTRLRPVRRDEIIRIAGVLEAARVAAVAVCLLQAYKNPAAEQDVRAYLSEVLPGVPVTLSAEIAPEIREYDRASTAVSNAFVQPMAQDYLQRLAAGFHADGFGKSLFVMLSEGGIGSVHMARAAPIRLVESGPAAGAIAAAALARRLGLARALSFDMGGTTAKLCRIVDGEAARSYATEIARLHRFKRGSGLPLKIPTIELIEIGAGGGSIAHVDRSGFLKVGPQSAGAEPGPACYGRGGTAATVTDADLVAGHIDMESFFGGRMRLDRAAAEKTLVDAVGARIRLSVQAAAAAVQQVVDENMALAARMHVVEHGEDPRTFTLLAFGGAGPVHAWRIARLLKIRQVIVPAAAGVASALGLLMAAPAIELSRSHVGRLSAIDLSEVDTILANLTSQAQAILAQAGVDSAEIRWRRVAECRYVGQAYEVQVAVPDASLAGIGAGALAAIFEAKYRELYGRTLPDGEVEALTWRVQAQGPAPADLLLPDRPLSGGVRSPDERQAYFPDYGWMRCTVLNRYALQPGDRLQGPALVEENETTTVVGPDTTVEVDRFFNLVLAIAD